MPLCWRPNFHESHSSDSWYYADYNGLEAVNKRITGASTDPSHSQSYSGSPPS